MEEDQRPVPRPFYYGQIRVDPTDDQRVYVLGVALPRLGPTAARPSPPPRPHGIARRPPRPVDQPEGLRTTSSSATTAGCTSRRTAARPGTPNRGLVISQFYGVAVDMRKPYRVYGGLQDNGTWGGPVATPYRGRHHALPTGGASCGGDGFQCRGRPERPEHGLLPRASTAALQPRRPRAAARRAAATQGDPARRPPKGERRATASTGTRPILSRRTTRRRSTTAATPSSSPTEPRRHLDEDQPRPDRAAEGRPASRTTATRSSATRRVAGEAGRALGRHRRRQAVASRRTPARTGPT